MFKGPGPHNKDLIVGKSSGFTLIEVMAAMLILLIGMITFFQLLMTSIKMNQVTKQMQMAQDTVSRELEVVKTVGYTGIKNNTALTSNYGYSSSLTSLSANYQMTGIDTSCNAPASFCVYKGLKVTKTVNNSPVNYYYTLKLAVDPGYLTYPALAQVDAKIYWRVGTTLKNATIMAFVGL